MSAARITLLLASVIILLQCSVVESDDGKEELLKYRVYDYTGEKRLWINASGKFRYYTVFEDAKRKIIAANANWCALGVELRKDAVPSYWTPSERASFDELMKTYDCEHSKAQGFFDANRSKRFGKLETNGDNSLIIIIILSIVIVILFAAIIVMAIISCLGKDPKKSSRRRTRRDRKRKMFRGGDPHRGRREPFAQRSSMAPQGQNRIFVDRHQPESSFTLASLLTKTRNRLGGQGAAPPMSPVVPHNAEPHSGRFLPPPVVDRAPMMDRAPMQDRAPIMQDRAPIMQDRAPIMQDRAPIMQDRAPIMQDRAPIMQDRAPMMDRAPMLPFMNENNDSRGGRGGCNRGVGRGGRGSRGGGGRGNCRGPGSSPTGPSPSMVHASSLGGPPPSNYGPVASFSFESLVRSPAPVAKELPAACSSSVAAKELPVKRPIKPTVRYFF
ncbi:hypothetical protein QR680_014430 [Steinernema hermaphroditum]|uniref:MHC class I-like antigen recognition-like domain-containing protein n=1 Tax=Steinernema hermaphroditum TaxID=289476 RepID=A0AA39IBI6_9BILA|nr:hypothetical protein QR680_014430 [Steinernema hermaphroditum]